jgi:hypothetical protein
MYRKDESSRPVFYSILDIFGKRSQYIKIKFPHHKHPENPRCAPARDYGTGKSLSEALLFTEHVVCKNCSECQKQSEYTTCSPPGLSLEFSCNYTCNSMNNLSS